MYEIHLYIIHFPQKCVVVCCVSWCTNLNLRTLKSLSGHLSVSPNTRENGVVCMTSSPLGCSGRACAVLNSSLAKLTTLVTFRFRHCCCFQRNRLFIYTCLTLNLFCSPCIVSALRCGGVVEAANMKWMFKEDHSLGNVLNVQCLYRNNQSESENNQSCVYI